MRLFALYVCCLVLACEAAPATPPSEQVAVTGFLDGGWPVPSGKGQPNVVVFLSLANEAGQIDARCLVPADSTVTDETGHFSLRSARARPARWSICFGRPFGDRVRYPVYAHPGTDSDAFRLYCRGHGPSGSPECRSVPRGAPMAWPTLETDFPHDNLRK